MLENLKEVVRLCRGKAINVLSLHWRKIKPGEGLRIYGKIHFFGCKNGALKIGRNVILRSGISTNPLGGGTSIILKTIDDGKIQIGNNVGITNSCIVSQAGVFIEDYVNIGGDCKIYDTDFHSIRYSERIQFPDKTVQYKEITIKEGAWIGAHSIILKGVTIGQHSVIGAGSVVAKDVPDNEVWAGNPAKFVKRIEDS